MTSKANGGISKRVDCLANKSFFDETYRANLLCKEQKKTENLNLKIFKTKNGRIIMQSKYALRGIKKSRFAKEQEAKGLLSNLGIKTPLYRIPLLGDISF